MTAMRPSDVATARMAAICSSLTGYPSLLSSAIFVSTAALSMPCPVDRSMPWASLVTVSSRRSVCFVGEDLGMAEIGGGIDGGFRFEFDNRWVVEDARDGGCRSRRA